MTKRSGRHLSKRGLAGLKRIKNKDGRRVWFYHDKEFETLREVVTTYRLELLRLLQN